MNQHFEKHTQATLKRSLDCIELDHDLWVYKVSFDVAFDSKSLPKNFKQAFRLPTYQGVAHVSQIEAFKKGTADRIENIERMVVGDAAFREQVRCDGFMQAWEAHGNALQTNTAAVYDLFVSGNIEPEDLVVMDIGTHSLFHRDGTPLPAAVYFDYMNGNFRNGSYDLVKAAEHLSNIPNVVLTPNREDEYVHEVPYYNRTSSSKEGLVFLFTPTREQFLALWPVMQKLHKTHPGIMVREAIFETDMLGLRACGAAKYDTYYGCDGDDMYEHDDDEPGNSY